MTAQALITDAQMICKEHLRKMHLASKKADEEKKESSSEENAYDLQIK